MADKVRNTHVSSEKTTRPSGSNVSDLAPHVASSNKRAGTQHKLPQRKPRQRQDREGRIKCADGITFHQVASTGEVL